MKENEIAIRKLASYLQYEASKDISQVAYIQLRDDEILMTSLSLHGSGWWRCTSTRLCHIYETYYGLRFMLFLAN